MNCIKCNATLSDQSKFCSYCGAQIKKDETAGEITIDALDKRLSDLEKRVPKIQILSHNYWIRAWSIFGHLVLPIIILYVIFLVVALPVYNNISNSKMAGKKQSVTSNILGKSIMSESILDTRLDFVKVKYDSDKWNVKISDTDNNKYEFKHANGDGYATLIEERIGMEMKVLRDIALTNARSASSDVKSMNEEYKTVNGTKIFCMDMMGTIKGISFKFRGYYWTSKNATVQFITYTNTDLFSEYEKDFDELLNGLMIKQ